ncbi:MAG: hypothetical protein RLY31_3 [Bacteroidota bacterium]|jgi:hypothetical protein
MYHRILTWTCLWLLSATPPAAAQTELSVEELQDYAARARNLITVFLENIPEIASGLKPKDFREAAARTTLKLFAANAYIQEKNKFSERTKTWKPEDYLNELTKRSEKAPVLIDFEIIDDLTPDKMTMKKNKDGSVSYFGKMVFRQYYCILKEPGAFQEPTETNPDLNCQYSDTTEKEVNFELTLQESITGKFWVTKIASIDVLRVF